VSTTVRVRVNGTERTLPDGTTVAALLAELGVGGPHAVEVNRAIVPRGEHDTRTLEDGDAVEIVTFVGGG